MLRGKFDYQGTMNIYQFLNYLASNASERDEIGYIRNFATNAHLMAEINEPQKNRIFEILGGKG